ncbi:hypothetical protein [Arthrobacter sp. NPDC090010]|uniref:hypothetical protein n=1 Tax=Arthrobacter sp. NPDC090010 TaxID=3363942 RepID=UPI003806193F
MSKTFGRTIYDARLKKKLLSNDVAMSSSMRMSGISVKRLWELENAADVPSEVECVTLSRILDVDLGHLLRLSGLHIAQEPEPADGADAVKVARVIEDGSTTETVASSPTSKDPMTALLDEANRIADLARHFLASGEPGIATGFLRAAAELAAASDALVTACTADEGERS